MFKKATAQVTLFFLLWSSIAPSYAHAQKQEVLPETKHRSAYFQSGREISMRRSPAQNLSLFRKSLETFRKNTRDPLILQRIKSVMNIMDHQLWFTKIRKTDEKII